MESPLKLTAKLLSIPPYISTSWSNVSSLYLKKKGTKMVLAIALQDGGGAEIPNLSQSELDAIFEAHTKFSEEKTTLPKELLDNSLSFQLPIKTDGSMLDSLGSHMQHNPEQADLPSIPSHILEKIGTVMRSFGFDDASILEKAEPNCNCVYCQLTRSLIKEEPEEIVNEDDSQFRDWEISQKEEKLYHVINPLDSSEYYDVFLGEPIGCTCGQKNCEHIKAVLNT